MTSFFLMWLLCPVSCYLNNNNKKSTQQDSKDRKHKKNCTSNDGNKKKRRNRRNNRGASTSQPERKHRHHPDANLEAPITGKEHYNRKNIDNPQISNPIYELSETSGWDQWYNEEATPTQEGLESMYPAHEAERERM